MKIISLTGEKNCGKLNLAFRLSQNSDVELVLPFTDREIPLNDLMEEYGDYHFVSKDTLDLMVENDTVLCSTTIHGNRYVFFENQFTASYNIVIVDDYSLVDLKTRFKGDLYTVKVVSKNQVPSNRVGVYLYDHEFDLVFDMDNDDYYMLEELIV